MASALQSTNAATKAMLEGITPEDVARLTDENSELRDTVGQIQKSLLAVGDDSIITDAEADELLARYGISSTSAAATTTVVVAAPVRANVNAGGAVVAVVVSKTVGEKNAIQTPSQTAFPEQQQKKETRVLAPA